MKVLVTDPLKGLIRMVNIHTFVQERKSPSREHPTALLPLAALANSTTDEGY